MPPDPRMPKGEAAAGASLKGPALMMGYERFIPSLLPKRGIEAVPLRLARLRKKEQGRQKAAPDAWVEGGNGAKTAVTVALIMAPGDAAVPEPLPIGLVAGAQ